MNKNILTPLLASGFILTLTQKKVKKNVACVLAYYKTLLSLSGDSDEINTIKTASSNGQNNIDINGK